MIMFDIAAVSKDLTRLPFITGSRAYGEPTDKSDVDLVVLIDSEMMDALRPFCDNSIPNNQFEYEDQGIGCLYFGKLNIIPVCHPGLYDVWKNATEFLKTQAPVEREDAVKYMNKKRNKWFSENR